MWFKNLLLYRLAEPCPFDADQLETLLARDPLQPCGSLETERHGWLPPAADQRFLFPANGQWLLALGTEKKLLPASVVTQAAKDRAAELGKKQPFPVGRRQLREIKEQVLAELLPRALSQRHRTQAWIDPRAGLLAVDTAADAKADTLLQSLRRSVERLPALRRVKTAHSPSAVMTRWLAEGNGASAFSIDQELELQSPDATKATVRYLRHPLDGREIRNHIAAGKVVTRLGLTWNDRISFVLTEQLQVKRIAFLDVLREQSAGESVDETERCELDFTLMTGELRAMLTDLITALGGE